MIIEAYNSWRLKEKIEEIVLKNKSRYQLLEDYYEWKQWSIGWITTRAWMSVVNERKKGKIYHWVVDNKTKDAVDTIASLTYGLNWMKISESQYFDINWEETIDKIAKEILIYDKAYVTIGKTTDWKVTLTVLNTKNSFCIKDKNWNIVEFVYITFKDKEKHLKTWETSGSTVIYREYMYDNIEIEQTEEIFPIYEIVWWFDYVETLVWLQDIINSMKTQEFEINKFTGDPLTVLKGAKLQDNKGKQIDPRELNLNAWWIIALGQEAELIRIEWEWVTQAFLDCLDREEKNFYKVAKLNWLRNNDLSWITSWYAIELKLIDTIAFVNKLRGKIMNWLKPIINLLEEINGEEDFELSFGNIVNTSLSDKIEEAKWLVELWFTNEEIRTYLWLSL